jgi:hypothetical protein
MEKRIRNMKRMTLVPTLKKRGGMGLGSPPGITSGLGRCVENEWFLVCLVYYNGCTDSAYFCPVRDRECILHRKQLICTSAILQHRPHQRSSGGGRPFGEKSCSFNSFQAPWLGFACGPPPLFVFKFSNTFLLRISNCAGGAPGIF